MGQGYFQIGNIQQQFSIAPNEIYGVGNIERPFLMIPITFSFFPFKQAQNSTYEEFDLLSLRAELTLTKRGILASESFTLLQFKVHEPTTNTWTLKFPLSEQLLYHIEKNRDGNLPGIFFFQLQYAKFAKIALQPGSKPFEQPSFVNLFEVTSGQTTFEIEQSRWINTILPALGHRVAILIEMPTAGNVLPVEYASAQAEIEEARKYFLRGDYDEAVGRCRVALQPFKTEIAKIKQSIASNSEFEWLRDTLVPTCDWLEKILKSTYTITNKPHHPPSFGHFGRSQAEILLNLTVLILTYIGRLGAP